MKAKYKYPIEPNVVQIAKLNKLFGCCRYVWNQSLVHCNQLYVYTVKKPSYTDLSKQFITQAKKELTWLKDVADTPLKQCLKDLDQAYQSFFNSCTSKEKGVKVKPPTFKTKKSEQTARFVQYNYKIAEDQIYLTKIGIFQVVGLRELPSIPISVTIIKDNAGCYFAIFVVEIPVKNLLLSNNLIDVDFGV